MNDPANLTNLLALGLQDGPEISKPLDFSDIPDGAWHLRGYELIEEIGRGGMGVIYKARQPHSNRIVALKRLRFFAENAQAGNTTAARLQREAEAVSSLDHPHILPIYEVGIADDGSPFYSMKLATAGSLAQVAKPVAERRAAEWLAKIARAVEHAHRRGVLHRDLKPANILLDADGEPLVADFGLAKWMDRPSDMTQSIMALGTPGYVAPEQAIGEKVGFAADIYSLGVILFEMLTGRLPFLGDNAWTVVKKASEVAAPRLRELVPTISRDLETICQRCLEREVAARYSSAGELAEDLQRFLDGRPVLARPIHMGETAWRWTLRNRIFTGCLVVALILGLATLMQYRDRLKINFSLEQKEAARRSLVILPFLNVDTAEPNNQIAAQLKTKIEAALSQAGSARISYLPKSIPEWTGAGSAREIIAATSLTQANFALTGIYRTAPDNPNQPTSVTIFLLKNDGKTLLREWHWPAKSFDALFTRELASEIYGVLDRGNDPTFPIVIDAAEANPVAANYLKVGNDLMRRRNLPDADRALACFESAIREAPQSILARSYLALATMGRQSMAPDEKIWQRGLAAAREALALQPESPAANRAYAVMLGMLGDYRGELDHFLRAITYGYESERAIGQVGFPYLTAGRPDLALRWYQKAKNATDHPAEWDAYIGDCLALLGRYEEAKIAYHSASEFHPELADGWTGMCRLLLRQRKFAEARTLYETKKDSFLNSPESKRLEAMIAFFSRDFTKAGPVIERLTQSERVGQNLFASMDWRVALARLETTLPENAQKWLEESIADEQSQVARFHYDTEAHYRLGAAYSVAHRPAEALDALKKAIELGWLDDVCLQLDPRWDAIREDPEFKKLIVQIGERKAIIAKNGSFPGDQPNNIK